MKRIVLKPAGKTAVLFVLLLAIAGAISIVPHTRAAPTAFPPQTTTLWYPYLEWSVTNASYSGNPYDLVATVTFSHAASGEKRVTEMFYDGANTWKFRFAGTRTGSWTFTTSSADPDLHGHSGAITVNPNPGEPGFITNFGNKWGRIGTKEAFVPQYVMASGPQNYYNNGARIDAEINTFLVQHGFNGFHSPVFCRWFDLNQPNCSAISGSNPNPDPRTFEALELLITKTYEAGGVVHLWAWGDDARAQNPNFLPGGINGHVDRRLQRYIAARLGALPGWTMGYGFDLFEWVSESQLDTWHANMQGYLGWRHFLGARSFKNQISQLSEAMDHASYEQHRPTYGKYVQAIDARPTKPAFSEDRFRIRTVDGVPEKDYTMLTTRRGLWDSTMAGGVANIWGNLTGDTSANDGLDTSLPYPNPEWIKTYATFWHGRFLADLRRCNELTDQVCLQRPNNADYIFYGEDVSTIQLNLSGMNGGQTAVAVDAARPYVAISLGTLTPANQTWRAPYRSDWAIAIGSFIEPACATAGPLGPAVQQETQLQNNLPYRTYLPLMMRNYCP